MTNLGTGGWHMEKCLESSQPGWTQPKAAGQNSSTLWSICRTELGPISCQLHPPHPGPLSLKGLSQASSQAPSLSGATTEQQSGPRARPSERCSRDRCDFIRGGPEVKCKVPECDSGWRTGPGEWGKQLYLWLVFSMSDQKLTGVKGGLK